MPSLVRKLPVPGLVKLQSMIQHFPQEVLLHSFYFIYFFSLFVLFESLFRGVGTPLSSSYNISGLVPVCWLLFQCF